MSEITRVIDYMKRYDVLPCSGQVIACVSGGADSMALLTVLLDIAPQFGFSLIAAHFDHNLRGAESDRDREFVKDYCEKLNIPIHIGHGDTRLYASKHKLGIEEAARKLRYSFFREVQEKTGAVRIATAHNADDNAETVLLSLARGAGTRGLSGIPPVRGDIIRPLLCVTREEIEVFLAVRSIPFITDSTNSSDRYARNRIRHHVTPVLKSVNTSYLNHVLESGELLRRDDGYLCSLAFDFLKKYGEPVSVPQLKLLPEAVSARVLIEMAGGVLTQFHVGKVLEMCRSYNGTKRTETPYGLFIREYDKLRFYNKPPEETFSAVEITLDTVTEIPELGINISCRLADKLININEYCESCRNSSETVNKSFIYFLFKKEKICGTIIVRPRKETDNLNIFGRNVTKSLKKLFIENKIPKKDRGLVPIIADDSGPLAIYGVCVGTRAFPDDNEQLIEISFTRTVDA